MKKPFCQHCESTEGRSEEVWTGDIDSKDGWELWFCCQVCSDEGLPCETFFRIE